MAVYDKFEAETEAELDGIVEKYMRRYHPLGYCTQENRRWDEVDNDTGKTVYFVQMYRLSSCD